MPVRFTKNVAPRAPVRYAKNAYLRQNPLGCNRKDLWVATKKYKIDGKIYYGDCVTKSVCAENFTNISNEVIFINYSKPHLGWDGWHVYYENKYKELRLQPADTVTSVSRDIETIEIDKYTLHILNDDHDGGGTPDGTNSEF